MTTTTNAPKIFISYSWKPISNKQKVIRLAERLTSDGIHVILDDWDLKEGQDKYSFMEQMVNDADVKRVLLICNKEYSTKANGKTGGVGIESLIVSDDIYSKTDQTKFIPIVFEYEEGKPCVPTFVKTRIFIDLCDGDKFEDNYEILLRNIFDKPASKRPPIGTAPSYITSEEPVFLPTAHKVSAIKNGLINEKKNVALLIQDYLDTFFKAIVDNEIDYKSLDEENFIDIISKRIDELLILRNDFVDFLNIYISNSITVDIEQLHRFFEKVIEWFLNSDFDQSSRDTFNYLSGDSTRFFLHELFLVFTTIFFEKERFNELAYILQTPFTIQKKNRHSVTQYNFVEFRMPVKTLNHYKNKKYSMNRVSIFSDMIKQRAGSIEFEKIIEADLLLYYISLFFPNKGLASLWFPELSCYRDYSGPIILKTASERYFNKIKILFGVNNKQELTRQVEEIYRTNKKEHSYGYYNIPSLVEGLNIEGMCTLS